MLRNRVIVLLRKSFCHQKILSVKLINVHVMFQGYDLSFELIIHRTDSGNYPTRNRVKVAL